MTVGIRTPEPGPLFSFSIAGVTFCAAIPEPLYVEQAFVPFLGGDSQRRVTVTVQEVEALPPCEGRLLHAALRFDVFWGEDGVFLRRFHPPYVPGQYYAVSEAAPDGKSLNVRFRRGCWDQLDSSSKLCIHICLETLLLHHDRLALHASFVDTPYGGLLFSGVSGIGKSTQAELWVQYEHAVQINGDRPILSRESNGWYAHGSPYAGSSRCYVNQSLPIRAIFLLEQGRSCALYRLPPAEAFRRLYAGTAVNSWDPAFVSHVCDLLTQLAAEVPVYHLTCTPDRAAIDAVKSVL